MTVNIIGLGRDVYKGLPTTLCAGCGHNSITNHLIKALYEYGVRAAQARQDERHRLLV